MGEEARGVLRGQGGGNRDPEVQWSGPQGGTQTPKYKSQYIFSLLSKTGFLRTNDQTQIN